MHARARRSEHFKASLFSDPAWDILLELFAAELEGRPLNVSAIGLTAKVPGTTVLRWIGVLETEGLIRRRNDPFDGRRSLVSLTEDGSRALREYFQL
jgi:DNA-binding MarR family transcriptional regulator